MDSAGGIELRFLLSLRAAPGPNLKNLPNVRGYTWPLFGRVTYSGSDNRTIKSIRGAAHSGHHRQRRFFSHSAPASLLLIFPAIHLSL
jgi:hypothetical protein